MDAVDVDKVEGAVTEGNSMQVGHPQDDALRIDDAVSINVTQHDEVTGSALGDVNRAIIGYREHPRVVESFGESVDAESRRQAKLPDPAIGRRHGLWLVHVSADFKSGQWIGLLRVGSRHQAGGTEDGHQRGTHGEHLTWLEARSAARQAGAIGQANLPA
ncbi:MAG TPA: hypothetical protein VNQ14_06535 [Woeseiaceae bacterium]|nr:hypothetical protein [Woeseiaceae bacterium]